MEIFECIARAERELEKARRTLEHGERHGVPQKDLWYMLRTVEYREAVVEALAGASKAGDADDHFRGATKMVLQIVEQLRAWARGDTCADCQAKDDLAFRAADVIERLSVENQVLRNAARGFKNRMGTIEDILGNDCDLDRLRELVEADREGRIKIHPKPENNTCGACGHFHRIAGRRCGTCDVQSRYRDKYGREDDRRGTFAPSQSRKACKRFEHREE